MNLDEFLRLYSLRAQNLMWFLGAGASAAAGLPTASSLIWEFKRTLFCTAQRQSRKTCEDLSNNIVRNRLNCYFQSLGTFPVDGSPEEYATYFEAAHPDPRDRRTKLDRLLSGAKPSYGHLVLAALMKMDQARIVWTVNFDKLLEDAVVQIYGSTSSYVVATLDNSEIALQAINEGRWPVIGKLHGDFQSRRLKNTTDEIKAQDEELRHALVESCRRYGLIVIGYSGRDESILQTLEEAIDSGRGYPGGLFWFQRSDSPIMPSVENLIKKAAQAGIQAELVELQTFDEFLGDIIKQFSDIPTQLKFKLDSHAPRISEIPIDHPGHGWPVIRFNSIPIENWPTICRRIVCKIGSTMQVREAIKNSQASVVGVRSQLGVLAFGTDSEIRKAFDAYGITEFDCHSLEPWRLRVESAELGLLRDAFDMAIARSGPFLVERRRKSNFLRIDFERASRAELDPLFQCVESLTGTIPKAGIQWHEALKFRLDYQFDRLWLLFEPAIYFDNNIIAEHRYIAADYVGERIATRYNRQWNALMNAWITLIMGKTTKREIASLGITEGIDAKFTFGKITGFSRRSISQ